jgi:hypothetical protein
MSVSSDRHGSRVRIRPSVWVAIAVVLADVAWTTGITLTSGLAYADIDKSAPNVVRMAVLPLAVGTVLLTPFLVFARWDHVSRDPRRLPTTPAWRRDQGLMAIPAVPSTVAGAGPLDAA